MAESRWTHEALFRYFGVSGGGDDVRCRGVLRRVGASAEYRAPGRPLGREVVFRCGRCGRFVFARGGGAGWSVSSRAAEDCRGPVARGGAGAGG